MEWTIGAWPLGVLLFAMILAAVIDGWKLKVPNWLTFPMIISGWILGLINAYQLLPYPGLGGLGGSLAGTALGFLLLFPVYAIGGMGAGDVKMQMAFGSWVGAIYPFAQALWIVLLSFCWGGMIGGVLAAGMIFLRGKFSANLQNTREIIHDLMSQGVESAAEKATQRKPRMHLLPYGIPLCLGILGYLGYYHLVLKAPLPFITGK